MTQITILYDNHAAGELRSGWGFSAFIRTAGSTLVFDTGADKLVLEHNAKRLNAELSSVAALVLSHEHCDHIGAVSSVFHQGLHLYVPKAFAKRYSRIDRSRMELHVVRAPTDVVPGVRSIGQMGREIPEQALLIDGEAGPVLLTGCAHAGVHRLARRATELAGEPLDLVIGGMHLFRQTADGIGRVIEELQSLGVQRVAPCHCTGDDATSAFRAAYGENFLDVAVGTRIEI